MPRPNIIVHLLIESTGPKFCTTGYTLSLFASTKRDADKLSRLSVLFFECYLVTNPLVVVSIVLFDDYTFNSLMSDLSTLLYYENGPTIAQWMDGVHAPDRPGGTVSPSSGRETPAQRRRRTATRNSPPGTAGWSVPGLSCALPGCVEMRPRVSTWLPRRRYPSQSGTGSNPGPLGMLLCRSL